jgi:hypothetical protein
MSSSKRMISSQASGPAPGGPSRLDAFAPVAANADLVLMRSLQRLQPPENIKLRDEPISAPQPEPKETTCTP